MKMGAKTDHRQYPALRHWKSEEIKERCQMTHTFCRGGDTAAESVMLYSDSGKMWMQKEE
jgi:hypothetical protein